MYNVDELVKDLIGKDITLCRDYPSIIKWSVDHIEKWTDSWTDYTITDPGILYINAIGFLYDIVNYVLDEAFLNNILRYTQSERALYSMSKFAGLTLPGYNCSQAKVLIENNSEIDVLIPRDFEIFVRDEATNEMIYFYSLDDLDIKSGKYGYGQFIEGDRVVIDTIFNEIYEHPNFEFTIPIVEVGLNSVFVYAEYEFDGDRETFTGDPTLYKMLKVDDALLNLASEPCYSVYYAFNKVVVQFCPGAADFFQPDSRIKIIFGKPAGLKANVGTVTAKPMDKLDTSGYNISGEITYTIQYATGASIPYDLEGTRVFIGNNVWRPETLVLNADFDNLISLKFPEIVRFTVNQEQGSEEMLVYYVPAETDFEGKPMTPYRCSVLEKEIYEYAKDLMFGGVHLSLQNSVEVEFDFVLEVYLNINTSDTTSVRDAIITVLKSYFDRTKQPRNFYFRRGHVITLIESGVAEVYTIDMTYPINDRQAADDEIFVLGDEKHIVMHFIQNNDIEEWG